MFDTGGFYKEKSLEGWAVETLPSDMVCTLYWFVGIKKANLENSGWLFSRSLK